MAALIALTLAGSPEVQAQARGQDVPRVSGWVIDRESDEPVSDAVVFLTAHDGSFRASDLTASDGSFRFQAPPDGRYRLRIEHLAYGEHEDSLELSARPLALRILLSRTAIELDPVLVDVEGPQARADRARGTARRVLTAEELRRTNMAAGHLGNALSQSLPGVRMRGERGRVGELVCIEFRAPVSLHDFGCKPPLVWVDGVQSANPTLTLNTISLGDIERVEVIPPGEAGVQYGLNSSYGVIVIETFSGRSIRGSRAPLPTSMRRYDWSVEPEPYRWGRTLAAGALANAAGLAVGYAVARSCLSFEDLTSHFYEPTCSTAANAGSRVALYLLPPLATAAAVRWSGSTGRSRGGIFRNTVAAAILAIPGIVLATTTEEDGFSGSDWIGFTFLSVGPPLAATLADRLFRSSRAP